MEPTGLCFGPRFGKGDGEDARYFPGGIPEVNDGFFDGAMD